MFHCRGGKRAIVVMRLWLTLGELLISLAGNAVGLLQNMRKGQRVYVLSGLAEIQTEAEVIQVDPKKTSGRVPKEGIALAVALAPVDGQVHVHALLREAALDLGHDARRGRRAGDGADIFFTSYLGYSRSITGINNPV